MKDPRALLRSYIAEAIRSSTFDMREFKSLRSRKEALAYAHDHLKIIGSGSSRSVFVVSSKKVLKIAHSDAGVAQNEAEVNAVTDPRVKDIFARIYDYDPDFSWVVSEAVREIVGPPEWLRLTGVSRKQFLLDITEKFATSDFAKKVIDAIDVLDLLSADVERIDAWGKTADGRVVLLDYGATEEIFDKFYGRATSSRSPTSAGSMYEAAQADKDDPYGEYLFAPERNDLPAEAREEENTPEEQELYDSLDSHYSGVEQNLDKHVPQLLDLVANGKYAKLLEPPLCSYYRALGGLSFSAAASMLDIDAEDLVKDQPKRRHGGLLRALKKSHSIMSWTTSPESEWLLDIVGTLKKGNVIMIFKAGSGDNEFFVNPEGMENVDGFDANMISTESEVISHGDVSYSRCAYYASTRSLSAVDTEGVIDDLLAIIGYK